MENISSNLTDEQRKKISEEINNPKTPYVKQEIKIPNWLAELFRDTLLPKP